MFPASLWAVLLVLALALTASVAAVAASSFSLVEGSPVLFAGATFSKQEDDFTVRLDWIGLAADLQWSGATLRLGAAAHPATIVANDGAAAFTLGLGAETARILSVLAAVDGSIMTYMQNTGEGSRYAIAGRATGATARIGLSTSFGLVPAEFDTAPARMIGQDWWPDEPGRDLAGKGWVNLTAALQSYRTRTDLVRLGYTREIEPGNWRGDIAYIGRYRPTGMGLTIDLSTGLAFGNEAFALVSSLGFRADVTDVSGVEMTVVGQSGSGQECAWISGSGWLQLRNDASVKLTVSAPIFGNEAEYSGPELFRPIEAAAVVLSLDFSEGALSRLAARYDLRTMALGVELASCF